MPFHLRDKGTPSIKTELITKCLSQQTISEYEKRIVDYRVDYATRSAEMSHPSSESCAPLFDDSDADAYMLKCTSDLNVLTKYGFEGSNQARLLKFGLLLCKCHSFKDLLRKQNSFHPHIIISKLLIELEFVSPYQKNTIDMAYLIKFMKNPLYFPSEIYSFLHIDDEERIAGPIAIYE